ncbi:PDR/VanB family oxidoreductase [Salininema proteolyticum]|uniref:PDR/VanB family oxidoreductase n=1 Tax=Salininema proteolyticum TaxID=1607685 RepID=A0ABV8U0U4_9ACTN
MPRTPKPGTSLPGARNEKTRKPKARIWEPTPVETEPPDDLYGRGRTDRVFRFMDALYHGVYKATARFSRPFGPPEPRDNRFTVTVEEVRREAEGVVSLRLARPGGYPFPAWTPGSHLDVTLPSGLRRQYSLNGDPDDRYYARIAVRLISETGGSGEVHRTRPGTELSVSLPHNAFPLVPDVPVLFVAGSIGITPILPMARQCERIGADWRLVYTGRTRASLPFVEELTAKYGTEKVRVRTDDEDGRPDVSALLHTAPEGGAVYLCGPPPMLDAAYRAFDDCPARRIHTERFSPPPITDGRPFEVQVGRDGPVLPVPADRTALDVLTDHDPHTPYSCRQGFCGTCKVRVLAGEADHRDGRLTDAEKDDGDMLVCVSRASGRLVVEPKGGRA